MKKLTELAIIFVLFGMSSWAQEFRHEVTIQGSGFFQKQTTAGGITNEPTNSGGVMAGYRFNLKNWLAVEGDYDYFRNHQTFSGEQRHHIHTDECSRRDWCCHCEASFLQNALKLPGVKIVSPFVLAGGGAMFFDPRGGSISNEQTRGAFVYGGGIRCADVKTFPPARTVSRVRL